MEDIKSLIARLAMFKEYREQDYRRLRIRLQEDFDNAVESAIADYQNVTILPWSWKRKLVFFQCAVLASDVEDFYDDLKSSVEFEDLADLEKLANETKDQWANRYCKIFPTLPPPIESISLRNIDSHSEANLKIPRQPQSLPKSGTISDWFHPIKANNNTDWLPIRTCSWNHV